MSTKIIFITTYKSRDFEGNALIGHYLKEHNIETLFVDGYSVKKKIVKLNPSVLIIDHLVWDHKRELVVWAKNIGLKVALLFTEGYLENMEYFDKLFGHPNSDKLNIDAYLVWNTAMIDRMKYLGYEDAFLKKVYLTGCQRFDFITNDSLKKLIISKNDFVEKFKLQSFEKIVTYMSTVAYQGYTYKNLEARYIGKAGYSTEYVKGVYDDSRKLFNNHTAIIKELALNNPNTCFIYKTHPSEAYISNYDAVFKGIPNIRLIVNENVRQFLFYSDLIIQRNCTTALEAWILNKPVVQIEDDVYENKIYNEHTKYSYIFKNSQEIDNFLKSKEYQNWSRKDVEVFLESIFYKLDGNAYKRIAEVILNLVANITTDDRNKIDKNIASYNKRSNRKPINIIKKMLFLSRETSLRPSVYYKNFINRNKPKKNVANEVTIDNQEVKLYYKKLDQIFN